MRFKVIGLILVAVVGLAAQDGKRSGIDLKALDPTCKPCDDFWRYANGGWLAKNPIPARYPSWGTMNVLRESNREKLRTILEAAAANKQAPEGSNERKIGEFYASCMDTAAIDARGVKPVQGDL